MLAELRAEEPEQGHLFEEPDPKKRRLMEVMDAVNEKAGRGALRLAASGLKREWRMKRQMLSPRYTTRWAEVPVATA